MAARLPLTRTLFLARHGETEWNRLGRWQGRTDVPLNDAGRAQAQLLANRLRPLGPGRIFASDLARAAHTAAIVSGELGLDAPELFEGLRERSYGVFEGLTREECAEQYPADWTEWVAGRLPEPPGAEPRCAAGERVRRAIEGILARVEGDERPVVAVSHGGVIRAFLLVATGSEVPPVPNVGVYRVRWVDGRIESAGLLDEGTEG